MPNFPPELNSFDPSHYTESSFTPAPARAEAAPASAPAAPAPAFSKVASSEHDVPLDGRFLNGAAPAPEDRLPESARRKYRRISAAADDASALLSASYGRVLDAQNALSAARARLRSLETTYDRRIDESLLASAEEKVEREAELLARLREEHEARSEATKSIRSTRFMLDRFCERQLSSVAAIEAAAPVAAPSLKKGESWLEAVNAQRAKISKLLEDAQAIEDAPQPSEVAKARARREIERLAEKGRPSIMPLIESATGGIQWPETHESAAIVWGPNGQPIGSSGRDGFKADPMALLCWLHRDELLRRIEAEIAERCDDASAMDDATRAKKRLQCAAAILEAERIEEAMIELAEEAGVVIGRREDADPRAILGLADSAPAPRR